MKTPREEMSEIALFVLLLWLCELIGKLPMK